MDEKDWTEWLGWAAGISVLVWQPIIALSIVIFIHFMQ